MKNFMTLAILFSLAAMIHAECRCVRHSPKDHLNTSDARSVGKEVKKTAQCLCDKSKCAMHNAKQKTEEVVHETKELASKAGQVTKEVVAKAGNTIKETAYKVGHDLQEGVQEVKNDFGKAKERARRS